MAAMVGEVVFADTNVLLSATDESRAYHREVFRLIAELSRRVTSQQLPVLRAIVDRWNDSC